MTKRDALRLIKALRSGKYIQTGSALGRVIDGVEYNCCLGVFCRLKNRPRVLDYDRFVSYDGSFSALNSALVGTKTGYGNLGYIDDHKYNLVGLNDGGYTFEEIADILYWYVESGLYKDI